MKLTERQRRFVEAFVETGNATEAARRAGYKNPNKVGPENLVKDGICKAIKARLKEMEAAKTATPEEVIQFLSASMRGEIKEDVVINEGTGDGCSKARIMKKQISARDRLEAAKQLLKRYPRLTEAEEERLRIEKLRAEVAELSAEKADDDTVQIIDDLCKAEDEKL